MKSLNLRHASTLTLKSCAIRSKYFHSQNPYFQWWIHEAIPIFQRSTDLIFVKKKSATAVFEANKFAITQQNCVATYIYIN